MQYIGNGFCNNGHYAGWDNKGESSEEYCKNLCVKEKQCTFATYSNTQMKKTCSRYNENTCTLNTTSNDAKDHKTFFKTSKTDEIAAKKGLCYKSFIH